MSDPTISAMLESRRVAITVGTFGDLNLSWLFKPQVKPQPEKFNGFLDLGTSFTGELSFEGTFRIDGEFHGSIVTNDLLVVGPRATIYADIKAGEARIHGSVFGNISGSRRIEISATGKVRGEVQAPQLVIEEGAVFEGRSHGAAQDDPQTELRTGDDETLVGKDPTPIDTKPAESLGPELRNEGEPLNVEKDADPDEQADSQAGGNEVPGRTSSSGERKH
jgi:cytoskeletal protein CcmA (bactofilin family)